MIADGKVKNPCESHPYRVTRQWDGEDGAHISASATLRYKYRVDQKKVNFVLDQLETCGFLQGVQHVSKNTSIVIFDIAKL